MDEFSSLKDQIDSGKIPVVEEFYSLQGEGYHTGKAAYFLRIGGCDVGCNWCDSKNSWNPAGFPLVRVDDIIARILECPAKALVVTGGEPLMYDLNYLTFRLRKQGIRTFLETSGSHTLSGEWDWICLSPKSHSAPLPEICMMADELKVVIESEDDFEWAWHCSGMVKESCHLFLQPEWSRYKTILPLIVEFVKKNPAWQVSLQSHKFMRIP